MELPHSSMDERDNKRKSLEISDDVALEVFVYKRETKDTDIPRTTLIHLRVDSSVTEIPKAVFRGCRALIHVQLPASLTRIHELAFYECYNLGCIQFVSRNYPLDDASSINVNSEHGRIVFPEGSKLQVDGYSFGYCQCLREIIVCSVSTKLGYAAFCGCSGLESVELPEGLQHIEDRLFDGCGSLKTVKIPSSVITIGSNAFSECQSLTSFDLPHGLLHIRGGSFSECRSIKTLYIPATVFSIGERAFENCTGLKYVRLPPTLETIEMYVFNACFGLEYINLPTSLERIGAGAFSDCTSLSHVRIPHNVKLIKSRAFGACSSLISLEIPEQFPEEILEEFPAENLEEVALFNFDLSNSDSLVNIAGPLLHIDVQFMERFMQNSKLGSVVDGYDDLVHRLKHRFDDSPLNKLCYYHSYHSSYDAMMQLRSLMDANPLAATTEVDEFGLTPLHTLSLSQTPNVNMLFALMKEGHLDDIIHSRDSFGSTPFDYLCLNRTPTAVLVIRTVLMTRFDNLLGLDRSWKSDMLRAVDEALAVDFSSRRREIVTACLKLAKYERKEILSLLELFLWKIKIDELGSAEELQIANRESCRIFSGASIVLPHVLPFLDNLDLENYIARSP